MPREEVSTFQFSWCSIWKSGESNFWVKICLAQERTLIDFVAIAVTSEFKEATRVIKQIYLDSMSLKLRQDLNHV